MIKRVKITSAQIDQRCEQIERYIKLRGEKAVRDKVITQHRFDDICNGDCPDAVPPRVGDVINWDGTELRVEQYASDGVIVTRVPYSDQARRVNERLTLES